MKQIFNSLLLICCLVFTTQAQPTDAPSAPASQNIIGLKMAFVTKQLALTNEEAQKFWRYIMAIRPNCENCGRTKRKMYWRWKRTC